MWTFRRCLIEKGLSSTSGALLDFQRKLPALNGNPTNNLIEVERSQGNAFVPFEKKIIIGRPLRARFTCEGEAHHSNGKFTKFVSFHARW